MDERKLSEASYERARKSVVAGVNSPVRSFRAVDTPPVIVDRGEGACLYDIDGNRYVDYLMSWGAIILGHAHGEVQAAIREAIARGNGFGLSTEVECELAELVKAAFPSIALLRFVNSGTEAVMSAIRLARGFTGRDKIVKFEGCYHGHSDGLLAGAGSGLATFGIPSSGGVPASFTAETLVARYNDPASVEEIFKAHGDAIACVVVEPVAGNMGLVPPAPGFLKALRGLCDRAGALLLLDEVITGFRVALGGAQEKYGVRPDLTTLGKIIGGGLPVGAFGGRREIMEKLAPLGDVYQAGTLSGNPVVASAGRAVLAALHKTNPYEKLEQKATRLTGALTAAAAAAGVSVQVHRLGSMFTLFFASDPITDYTTAKKADSARYAHFFRIMLEGGVLLPPSQWETAFVGVAHEEDHLTETARVAGEAFQKLARGTEL